MLGLSGVGIWSRELTYASHDLAREAAFEVEELGFSALWIPDVGGDPFGHLETIMSATSRITVGAGVLNIARRSPRTVSSWWRGLPEADRRRLVIGLGVGHSPDMLKGRRGPIAAMNDYLDALTTEGMPLTRVVLAALGPKMTDLACTRTAGAMSFLVPTHHTRRSRRILVERTLVVEVGVALAVCEEDAVNAVVDELSRYSSTANYVANLERLGYSREQVEACDMHLMRDLFALGGVDRVQDRIAEHRRAGADHICLQVVPSRRAPVPLDQWRRLAATALPRRMNEVQH